MFRRLLVFLYCLSLLQTANAVEDDEQGLLMIADKHEQQLRTSPARIKDPRLEDLISDMVCNISAQDCSSVRSYVLRAPGLNAFMMPNGAMFLQTGLLLRMTSDSELASVIGHEIVHYTESHNLKSMRSRRKAQKVVSLLSIPVNIAGGPLASTPLSLIGAAYLSSYSKSAEQEADIKGIKLIREAGYNPKAVMRVWGNYANESEAAGSRAMSIFSTHPMVSERLDYLDEYVKNNVSNAGSADASESRLVIDHIDLSRSELLSDEMRSMTPRRFNILLNNQRKFSSLSSGTLDYLCASSWVLAMKRDDRSVEENEEAGLQASACFERGAQSKEGMPAIGYREWAKLSEKMNKKCRAKRAYQAYLEREPDAWDSKFVSKRLGKLAC